MVNTKKASAEVIVKEKTRNSKVALTLGRQIYTIVYTGSAYSQFPVNVAMMKKQGLDTGELNHSAQFAAKFGEAIGVVVKRRVTKYLSSPLPQTGLPPPVKFVADKATNKHWSNNLTGVLTIVPNSPNLIQGVFLAAPRCERSTGEALSKDIHGTAIDYKISPSQVTGLAGDGAYSHCQVGEKLDELLEIKGIHDTDFCHIAGRVDVNMRELTKFKWVSKFVLIVAKSNKLINWGQAWHIFFKVHFQ